VYHAEGRCAFVAFDLFGNPVFNYEYALKDHLGNTRLTFRDVNSNNMVDDSEILQQSHYYPFGMEMEGSWSNFTPNMYLYNGKELNEDFDLNWLDYGARWYEPASARWSSVDPLAVDYAAWSPYNYVMGNPISLIDPDGRAPDDIIIRVRDNQGETYMTLDYRNDGQLYTVDGKLYEGDNSVARGIQGAINEARGNDDRLDQMFSELESSSNEHEWTNNDPESNRTYSSNRREGRSGTITQFAPEENKKIAKANGRLEPTNSDIASHEGKHAYDRDKNKIRSSSRRNGVPDSEVDAINTANINRAAEGRTLRTNFGGRPINKDKLQSPETFNPLHDKK
jgi:RHS repeat-associated protein